VQRDAESSAPFGAWSSAAERTDVFDRQGENQAIDQTRAAMTQCQPAQDLQPELPQVD
jgi:hypothetical protein